MTIQFDKDGYATSTGTVIVHNAMPDTREYIGSSDELINTGQGLPARAYLDSPPSPKKGFVICRTSDQSAWEYVADHRGEVRYSTTNGNKFIVSSIGDYPTNSTDIAPATEFDKWEGAQWITDIDAQHLADVNAATAKKAKLMATATAAIAPLEDAVEYDIATDEEIKMLAAWKKYRVLINRIDTSEAPAIAWASAPI